jgi:hypothetical protein
MEATEVLNRLSCGQEFKEYFGEKAKECSVVIASSLTLATLNSLCSDLNFITFPRVFSVSRDVIPLSVTWHRKELGYTHSLSLLPPAHDLQRSY